MESNNTLPTVNNFLNLKRLSIGLDVIPMPYQIEEWISEYAVLFARHHVAEALINADNVCTIRSFNMGASESQLKELSQSILNSYHIDEKIK